MAEWQCPCSMELQASGEMVYLLFFDFSGMLHGAS